jgi:hypothetical protein
MAAETIKKKQLHSYNPRTAKSKKIIEIKEAHPELSTVQIGKLTDCTHANVIRVLQNYGIIQQDVKDYKENRADVLAGLQHRLISSVTDQDIKKTPVGSRILAVAQLYDKERLERGQSTNNISYMDVSKRLETLKAERDKIKQAIAADSRSIPTIEQTAEEKSE